MHASALHSGPGHVCKEGAATFHSQTWLAAPCIAAILAARCESAVAFRLFHRARYPAESRLFDLLRYGVARCRLLLEAHRRRLALEPLFRAQKYDARRAVGQVVADLDPAEVREDGAFRSLVTSRVLHSNRLVSASGDERSHFERVSCNSQLRCGVQDRHAKRV